MPKISVVIPVWNVEQFLPQCLDSVINQTMRDIEIICVNDGSPDNSPQILEKYAARDSRITVIHKENGGLSSARNAAYPYIRSKYTLFVDSDDYIDPSLCEKTYKLAEQEQADMTFFFFHRPGQIMLPTQLEKYVIKKCFTGIRAKQELMDYPSAWSRIWNTQFLHENNIRFPEGLYFEDLPVHWKAMNLSRKLVFLNERLYYYRINDTSITRSPQRNTSKDIIPCFELIKKNLQDMDLYRDEWKQIFLRQKLRKIYFRYYTTLPCHRLTFLTSIKNTLGDDEREFLNRENDLHWYVKDFFYALDDSTIAIMKNSINPIIVNYSRKILYRINQLRSFFRQ